MSCKKCSEIKTPLFTGLTDSNGNKLFDGDYLDNARFPKVGYTEILDDCRILYDATKAAFICVGIDHLDNLNTNYLHNVIGHTAVKNENKIKNLTQELLDFYGTDLWRNKFNEYLESKADLEDIEIEKMEAK